MAQIKFFRGKKASYGDGTGYENGIYFSTDTHEIFVDKVSYGFPLTPDEVVKDITYDKASHSLTITKGNEDGSGNVTSSITIDLASKDNDGLMSREDKDKLDKVLAGMDGSTSIQDQINQAVSNAKNTIDNYTVNKKKISTNPVLNGGEILLDGYTKAAEEAAVAPTDTINVAIGKVELGNEKTKQALTEFIATKGQANGIASLDENGKVPANQLSGELGRVVGLEKFVDTKESLPTESVKIDDKYYVKTEDKIYTATSASPSVAWDEGALPHDNTIYNHRQADSTGRTNVLYRWDGKTMVEISASLALGETQGTAYEGSKGKANAAAIKVLQAKDTAIDAYTVNGKKISANPTLTGADVAITGYTKPGVGGALTAEDTINAALGKLEYDLDAAEAKLGEIAGEGEGSIADQIQNAVDEIKGGASRDYDTLGELEAQIKKKVSKGAYDEGSKTLTLTREEGDVDSIVLPDASSSVAGLMTAADKQALDKAVSDITNIQNQVTVNKIVAGDNSVEVTPGEDNTSIKVKLKADSNALKLDPSEGLYVDETVLTPYTGTGAIKVSNKAISLTIKAEDKVLSQSADGLLTNINLTWSTSDGLKLVGKDGAEIATIPAEDFIKDGMLEDVELVVLSEGEDTNPEGLADGTYLKFTFNAAAESKIIYVNVTSLIDIYTAGNGIELSGKAISVKIDASGETKYLTVGVDGLKLSGIDSAISTAVSETKATIDAYTVNGKTINTNPTLSGADIALTGYSLEGGVVTASDTVNQAINKLDDALIWHEAD